jgi:peptide-methionine (R)-S-oxide reductase
MVEEKPDKIQRSDAEWRELLSPERYHVLREHGTERAFTGGYTDRHDPATYLCAGCDQQLFHSAQKYDSGSGWPSFYAPIDAGCVETNVDRAHGMVRTEVHCARCGGHLGHVFSDGPQPTGLRYCINSASLRAVDGNPPDAGEGRGEGRDEGRSEGRSDDKNK